jgi:hypothetical protein
MNSIKYACSLNNQGVDLLVSGESSRAITVFQSAVGLLQKEVRGTETTCRTEVDESCNDASLPFCESTSPVSGLQDGESDVTISLYIAIVLFNLALASHCEGIALGRAKLLKKASVLYSLVVKLLTCYTMPKDACTTILTLLALNNQAQIHYEQCEYAQSVGCMKYISTIMGGCRGLDSALNQEDLEGLQLNVMLMGIPSAAQAA